MNSAPPIQTLRPAVGTRMGYGPLGTFISNPHRQTTFLHPWQPSLVVPSRNNFGLRLWRGVVDGYEPTINGEPMSGLDGQTAPALKLDSGAVNSNDESWAVLEVTPNSKGAVDGTATLQIVHSSNTSSEDGSGKARIALTLIQWSNGNPVAVWPVVFFNLRYTQTGTGTTKTKHFFF